MDNDTSFKAYMARLAPLIARRFYQPFSYVAVEPCGKHVIYFSNGTIQAMIYARPVVREDRHVILLEVDGEHVIRKDVVNFRPIGLFDADAHAFAQAVTKNALRRIP